MRETRRGLLRALLVLALLCAAVLPIALERHPGQVFLADFRPLHLGAQCLLDRCDPYVAADLDREAAAREPDGLARRPIQPEAPVYPPSALVLVAPLARVPWPVAGFVFAGLSLLTAIFAAVALIERLAWQPLVGVLVLLLFLSPGFGDALSFGNPALLCVALTTFALVACGGVGTWVPLGLALAIKPQLAAPALLLLLFERGKRGAAAKAAILALGLLGVGVCWTAAATGSLHFVSEIGANIQLSALPGHSTDPSPANDESYSFLNVQPLLARLAHLPASVWSPLALGFAGIGAVLGWTGRPRLRGLPWTLLGLVTLICILPVYHREYDRVLALLLIPAATELPLTLRRMYVAALTLWLFYDWLFHHIARRVEFLPWAPALTLLLLAVLLLNLRHGDQRSGERGELIAS